MRALRNISIEPNVAPGIDLLPLIGEAAWHAVTIDPTIADVSVAHLEQLVADIRTNDALQPGLRLLEVAAYGHITGYMFAENYDANVTLFDVSASTLRLGRDLALEMGISTDRVRRVAGDFHKLPFDTGEFDVVYIASALHHSWRWRVVLAELVRVTKVGGYLILENEPCRREFCFYRFRTNRLGDQIATETLLDQIGLLRTVAEPYLGSRAEQLFGMTENQEIRLSDLLGQLGLSSAIAFIRVLPQICMGSLENALDKALLQESSTARDMLISIVRTAFDRARGAICASGTLPPAMLPEETHVDAMIKKISNLLEKSTYGRGELLLAASGERTPVSSERLDALLKPLIKNDTSLPLDLDRATLFGAAIKVIARKQFETVSTTVEWAAAVHEDGVALRFEPEILRLMDPKNMLFPHMQRAAIEDIAHALGADWHVVVNGDGIRVANPVVVRPCVSAGDCMLQGDHALVFARVYGVGGRPWTLWLTVEGERRASIKFEKSESAILVASVSNAIGPILVEFEAEGLEESGVPPFNMAYLGVLRVAS